MTQTKNARPCDGTQRRAAETAALDGAAASIPQSNTSAAAGQPAVHIASLLLSSAENAVPLRQLAALTGMDARCIRKQIEFERRRGVPICADNAHGYYLAADAAERDRFVRSMLHRAEEIKETAQAVAAAEV